MVAPGFFYKLMKIAVPQQKTFEFPAQQKAEEIDKEINEWRVQVTKEGNQPSPNPPTVIEDQNGYKTYVCMFAAIMEIDLKNK